MSIEERIRAHVANDAELLTALGAEGVRVRPLNAEADDDYPYCVYAVISDDLIAGSNSGNGKLHAADVEFAVVATDITVPVSAIGKRIEDILPAMEGTIGSDVRVDAVNVTGRAYDTEERDDADDRQLFIQRIAAQVIYTEWTPAGTYEPVAAQLDPQA
jgi:hypothetical protein